MEHRIFPEVQWSRLDYEQTLGAAWGALHRGIGRVAGREWAGRASEAEVERLLAFVAGIASQWQGDASPWVAYFDQLLVRDECIAWHVAAAVAGNRAEDIDRFWLRVLPGETETPDVCMTCGFLEGATEPRAMANGFRIAG